MMKLTISSLPSILGRLAVGPAIVLVATAIAQAQWTSNEPADESDLQFSEDFDSERLTGWGFSCEHSRVPTRSGKALQTGRGGHALWVGAGDVQDFVLQFRYGYEQGVGDVIFRITETSEGMECYCLIIQPEGISLVRRLHTPGQEFPEQQLAAVDAALPSRQWHDFTIQAVGGQIDVAVGDQHLLSYTDPAPLTSGICGLGVIANSGAVLYDRAVLIPMSPVLGTSYDQSTDQAANWP
jgi:hypothetical protein